jgi:hypothetical protein
MLLPTVDNRCLYTVFLASFLYGESFLQTTSGLSEEQGQLLCDEIANMLLNTIEAQDIDNKVEAVVNVFLRRQKIDGDPAKLAKKISWSIKVRLAR